MFIYTTYDYKAKCFSTNFYAAKNDDDAVRAFISGIKMAPRESLMIQFPEDYALFRLAEFNEDIGIFYSLSGISEGLSVQDIQPIRLISCLEAINIIKSGDTSNECCGQRSIPQADNEECKEHSEEVLTSSGVK